MPLLAPCSLIHLFQDPSIFAAAALGGVNDQRAFFQSYAGEASGHDVYLVAEENIRPQVHVARLQLIADEAWRAGKIQRGLCNVVARIGFDLTRKLLALTGCRVGSDQHSVTAALAYRLHYQLVQVCKHMATLFLVVQQVGFHVGKNRLLAKVVADHARHIGVDGLVIGEAGAEGVGYGDIAGSISVEQSAAAKGRIGAEDQRVAEVVVHAAVNHVHALEPVSGAHVDDVVVGYQVAAFHQVDAHLPGEIGVLEVCRVEDAWSEQHDIRLRPPLGSERPQRGQQLLRIMFDGPHAITLEELRKGPLHNPAVGEHVTHAGGNSEVIFEHHKLACVEPEQVRAHNSDVYVARHL